jgi:adenine/guanine phosphoribosyltransferase-like PRPP-binding protein
MAFILSEMLSLPVDTGIIQNNKVGHTRAKGWHRFVTPALFEGSVHAGASYILIDDHVGHGGTLANMRAHIEAQGGQVLLMSTLTETREARSIALTKGTYDMLKSKHG